MSAPTTADVFAVIAQESCSDCGGAGRVEWQGTCTSCRGRGVLGVLSEKQTREVERLEALAYVARHGLQFGGAA
jgi:DnaJ-class molecular chaperone